MVDTLKTLDEVYRFDIITDPDDPHIRNSLDNLLGIVENNDNFILTETNLDRGLVRYSIDTVYDIDQDPNVINRIDQLTGEVSYIPVTVTMDISKFGPDVNIGSVITGAEEIIKELTELLLSVEIVNVESMRRVDDIIIFTPIDHNNNSVYENPMYLSDYYRFVNMDVLGGYQILSKDPIIHYVLYKLYQNGEYVPEDINGTSVQGVVLLPVGYTNTEEDYYRNIRYNIETLVTTRRQDGYFSIKLGIHNIADVLLIDEMAKLWDTEIVYDKDMLNIILKHNHVEFGTLPELWFQHNLNFVKKGDFPFITLYGLWQFKVGGDYNQIYDKHWNQAIIQYGALLAYRKLGEEDPFIQPYTHTVTVNNDLSITLALPTYNHTVRFREYFNDILNGYVGMEHQGEQIWFAEPVKDLLDGVIKRWYIQTIDKRSMPMVLKQIYEDGRTEEILIFRSPAVGLYYSDSPLDFENVNMEEVRNIFIETLRDYYKLCHGNTEPVLLENIDTMDLAELLDLIEIQERRNGPTYCYSSRTLLNLVQPISPITRRPLPDHIFIKAMLMEWGLRGLFGVGPLLGLYSGMPSKILVEPKSGVPIINKVTIPPIQHAVTGDIYSVSVGFTDGTLTDLFEIATDNLAELKRLIEELWNSGFFLSYWVSAVQKYSDTMNSFVVIITSPLLLQGADSKSDGERAMNYLKESADNLSKNI